MTLTPAISPPPLKDKTLLKNQGCIDGEWTDGKSGETFQVHDPASGDLLGTMPDMDEEDTQRAVAAAALPLFRRTTARERARLLRRWYDLTLTEALNEVEYAADFLEWLSEEAPRAYGETISASVAGRRVYTLKESVGVCGLITPWNWPAGMITRKVGAALAAGCTVVLKSPGETPLTAAALAELAHRAGVPAGAFDVVTALSNTPRDLDAAVAGAIQCKFKGSGQTCTCANRIYVHEKIYAAFVEAFVAEVKKFRVGPGHGRGVTHGRLIHGRAVTKAEGHIEDATGKGATLLVGGKRLPELGPNFFEPAVLSGMTSGTLLAREETFGPVAGLFSFGSESEVIELANDSDVGLTGYSYSRDVARCHRVAEALDVGMVGVNTGAVCRTSPCLSAASNSPGSAERAAGTESTSTWSSSRSRTGEVGQSKPVGRSACSSISPSMTY
ncbi:succinate semialdehyde dehydrogenase NADP+ linked [Exophiala oligosperma]